MIFTPRPRLRGASGRDNALRPGTADTGSDGHAEDLEVAWKNVSVTMRSRQQLARGLVNDISVDIDEPARGIVLIMH